MDSDTRSMMVRVLVTCLTAVCLTGCFTGMMIHDIETNARRDVTLEKHNNLFVKKDRVLLEYRATAKDPILRKTWTAVYRLPETTNILSTVRPTEVSAGSSWFLGIRGWTLIPSRQIEFIRDAPRSTLQECSLAMSNVTDAVTTTVVYVCVPVISSETTNRVVLIDVLAEKGKAEVVALIGTGKDALSLRSRTTAKPFLVLAHSGAQGQKQCVILENPEKSCHAVMDVLWIVPILPATLFADAVTSPVQLTGGCLLYVAVRGFNSHF